MTLRTGSLKLSHSRELEKTMTNHYCGLNVEAFRVSDHGQVRVGDDYATSFGDSDNVAAQVGHNSGWITNTYHLLDITDVSRLETLP